MNWSVVSVALFHLVVQGLRTWEWLYIIFTRPLTRDTAAICLYQAQRCHNLPFLCTRHRDAYFPFWYEDHDSIWVEILRFLMRFVKICRGCAFHWLVEKCLKRLRHGYSMDSQYLLYHSYFNQTSLPRSHENECLAVWSVVCVKQK